MGVDLTNELAEVLLLSVSDNKICFLGKRFVDLFSGAVISSDIKTLQELNDYVIDMYSYPVDSSWHFKKGERKCQERVLRVFEAIKNKLHPITNIDDLIEWFSINKEFYGWGDIIVQEMQTYKKKGILYINLDYHPYRYADAGMPYCEYWLSKELENNKCPFTEETAYDCFFELVNIIRNFSRGYTESAIYERLKQLR